MKENIFSNSIYVFEKREWVEDLNKHTDKYIEEAKRLNKNKLINNRDFGIVHHSTTLMYDDNFKTFNNFICERSFFFLNDQGYDINNYAIIINELWVQEFPKEGGGLQTPHVHDNCHMSGFYFLKCSDKTSYPVFQDPRPGKVMTQLPIKENGSINEASDRIFMKIKPGVFMFFNSYLTHEFTLDYGIEPFRFIHFNLKAIPKQLIRGNIEKI